MAIVKAFMVPHPPLIVPEVGKGEEEKVRKTINSYREVAKEIASINPDTIVISSPHAKYYADYFYISGGEKENGNFGGFGASNVSFTEKIDLELVEEIEKIAKEEEFPAGRIKEVLDLDHGTMVPLYFIRKELPKCKIVVVGLSSLPLIDNYKFGMIIRKAINNINRKVVYVASGDLSHKLQEYGPYGFVEEGPMYDERIMDVCSKARFNELMEFKEEFLEKCAECGHRSFTIMAGTMDGMNVDAKYYSHEDITGVGYGICSFTPNGDNEDRKYYDKYLDKVKNEVISNDEYVNLARETINKYIGEGKVIEVPKDINRELLNNKSGVFVSIHKFGLLRGCIGTFLPTKDNIALEIINNAISASTSDYRFSPITKEELPYLEINVDVLSTPEDIEGDSMLDPKRYGVIVSSGFKRGLLLPDLDGIDTIKQQIDIARRKGGILPNEKINLQRFEVIRHK